MPEGDTIHTIARVLGPDLVGQVLGLIEIDKQVCDWGHGVRVTSCDAVGKHLLIGLGDGSTLRVHLGMKGSWHRYRVGEAWRRHPDRRRLVLQTPAWLFVCFGPKEVEVMTGSPGRGVSHLGPDLLGAFSLEETLRRARRHPALALADLLLTQTVAAGIGNVYKSELLHLERLHPWRRVGATSDEVLAAIYRRAEVLMRDNLETGGWRITTTREPTANNLARHWVYRRARRPCFSCGALVRSRLQGPMARMTYWCPQCQPLAADAGAR
jgi:endonuclease-8